MFRFRSVPFLPLLKVPPLLRNGTERDGPPDLCFVLSNGLCLLSLRVALEAYASPRREYYFMHYPFTSNFSCVDNADNG